MIPSFPTFKRLELSDGQEVGAFVRLYPPYSDFNFANLWCYDTRGFCRLSMLHGNLVVQISDYITGEPALSFLGVQRAADTAAALLDHAAKHGLFPALRLVPEMAVAPLMAEQDGFVVEPDEDSFDYIHCVEQLISLEHPAILPKRRKIENLRRKHPGLEVRRLLGYVDPRKLAARQRASSEFRREYADLIDFDDVQRRACAFADAIEAKPEELAEILLQHESYEVAVDETARTLDLLRNLHENAAYFQRKIGAVAAFLPRNQPLYALSCFGLVPALMASEVYIKPPTSMEWLFTELAECLWLSRYFPNVQVVRQERQEFVRLRAARGITSSGPLTDAVIFTGTMTNADRLRAKFDARTLFIANGAGHNPFVIAEDANLDRAVSGVLCVQLYNSGQDCASPNAVLVHRSCYAKFVTALREAVRRVHIGDYRDRENRVGPLSDQKGLSEILETFIDNAPYLDPLTPGVIRSGSSIVEPTIILKPLAAGGNFTEYFAPIFFVQCCERDEDLSLYFDDHRYAQNAMYITTDGHSPFVEGLLKRVLPGGRRLHDHSTIIRNTNLHAPGIERGTQPYGGYGRGASCIGLNGITTAKPTLPQRDLFEYLVRPTIR